MSVTSKELVLLATSDYLNNSRGQVCGFQHPFSLLMGHHPLRDGHEEICYWFHWLPCMQYMPFFFFPEILKFKLLSHTHWPKLCVFMLTSIVWPKSRNTAIPTVSASAQFG